MEQPSRPNYTSALSKSQGAAGIHDVHHFLGPMAGASVSKYNRASTSFNFLNADISKERGRPNAYSKETRSSIYGGSIGGSE